MQVTVQRFRGFGGDEIGSGGLDLYVWHQIASNYNGALSQGRLPSDGAHDGDTWDLGPLVVPITDRVHGDLSITVFFEGWDKDTVSADDKLGTINFGNTDPQFAASRRPAYTVDSLWGKLEQQSPEHRDGDFAADYVLGEKPQPVDMSQPIRSQVFWPFKNFDTDKLSYDQYAETFANVDKGTFIDFDPLYYLNKGWQAFLYEAFYKSCASGGNCFGMCLEALYSRFGRSFYAEPIYQWGNAQDRLDQSRFAGLTSEINVKHGYQLGAANFGFFLASFLAGETHDPIAVFRAAKQAFDRGDYPIIELCDYFGQRAHAVLPIGFDDTSFPWRVLIADPNHPFDTGDFDSRYQIQVYSDNSFKYVVTERDGSIQSEPKYSGNELLGSRMFYVPYSILSYKPHTPETQFVTAFFDGVLLMVGNAAQTEQITDLHGRSFYKDGAATLPTRWQDIMPRGAGRIPGLTRIPLSHGNVGPGVELYFGRTDAGRLVHAVRAPSSADGGSVRGGYVWGMHTPAMSVLASVSANSDRADTFSMELAGSADPMLTVTASESKTMDLHVTNGRGEASMKAGVALKAQQAFALKLSDVGLHCK